MQYKHLRRILDFKNFQKHTLKHTFDMGEKLF